MAVDWDNFPSIEEPEERLKAYRQQMARDEATGLDVERRRVAEVRFKQDLGLELTQADRNVLAYSVYGTAAGCHHP